MFIVKINYQKPLEMIDQYLSAHRSYLDKGYQNNILIASGPLIPRTGGILFSQLSDKEILNDYLKQDPFYIYDLANYEIIEFTPIKYHQNFSIFIEQQ